MTCLTPHVPHAEVPHAGGVLLHHRLLRLAEHYDVVVVAPRTADNEQVVRARGPLPVVLAEASFQDGGRWASAVGLARAASGRLDSSTPRLGRAVTSPPVAELLARSAVVEVHWGEYLPLLPVVAAVAPTAARGVFLHDVVTEARAARARNRLVWLPERAAFRMGGGAARRRELELLGSADVAFVLKQKDADLLRPHDRCRVVVAQPWLAKPDPAPGPAHEPVACFVAAMWREENAAGALWLLQHVWPEVRRRVPAAELRLVGARPPAVVASAAVQGGVVVTGFVDDLDAEYRRTRVALAPLDTDTGLKVKVLQAMAYGLPVVARPEALVGLESAPSHALGGAATDPGHFAALVSDLLLDDARAGTVGRAARQWVDRTFDLDADVRQAVDVYSEVTARRLRAGEQSR